jgi:hypothetical protein
MSKGAESAWIGSAYVESVEHLPVSLVETESFIRQAKGTFSEDDLAELKLNLAGNPKAGRLVPRTGGLRKLRFSTPGTGKRSGARVIYYYHSGVMPILLLAVYRKAEKINLTAQEIDRIRSLVRETVKTYMRQRLRVVR